MAHVDFGGVEMSDDQNIRERVVEVVQSLNDLEGDVEALLDGVRLVSLPLMRLAGVDDRKERAREQFGDKRNVFRYIFQLFVELLPHFL